MRNDYRSGRKVLHVVVEVGLHDRVKALAAADRCSITEFVTRVLEEGTGYDANVESSGDCFLSGAAGGVDGFHGGGDSGEATVGGVVGRGVDWDSILAAGKKPVVEPSVVSADEWLNIA
jgi:hypothetical protein